MGAVVTTGGGAVRTGTGVDVAVIGAAAARTAGLTCATCGAGDAGGVPVVKAGARLALMLLGCAGAAVFGAGLIIWGDPRRGNCICGAEEGGSAATRTWEAGDGAVVPVGTVEAAGAAGRTAH